MPPTRGRGTPPCGDDLRALVSTADGIAAAFSPAIGRRRTRRTRDQRALACSSLASAYRSTSAALTWTRWCARPRTPALGHPRCRRARPRTRRLASLNGLRVSDAAGREPGRSRAPHGSACAARARAADGGGAADDRCPPALLTSREESAILEATYGERLTRFAVNPARPHGYTVSPELTACLVTAALARGFAARRTGGGRPRAPADARATTAAVTHSSAPRGAATQMGLPSPNPAQ